MLENTGLKVLIHIINNWCKPSKIKEFGTFNLARKTVCVIIFLALTDRHSKGENFDESV